MRYLLRQKRYALDCRESRSRVDERQCDLWEVCKRHAEVLEIPSTMVSANQKIRFHQHNITFDTKIFDLQPTSCRPLVAEVACYHKKASIQRR